MVLIHNTNIIVDDFTQRNKNPWSKYIYFLTHMHADHYKGLMAQWNYGTIYCSELSKSILLNLFPGVGDIRSLPLNTPTSIFLDEKQTVSVTITFFDANHCPGSVMILFQGYMGCILHTGDMRFNKFFFENELLYPLSKRNPLNEEISLKIDEVIFDNTFCDPIFNFPDFVSVVPLIHGIIETTRKEKDYRYAFCVDSLGKEDIFIHLAKKWNTKILVSEQRFRNMIIINLEPEIFTTDPKQGWISMILKQEREQYLHQENYIVVTLTGWIAQNEPQALNKRNYIVPYRYFPKISLHSNYKELELFIKSIRPCKLTPICIRKHYGQSTYDNAPELIKLMKKDQIGLSLLQQDYCQGEQLSKEYMTPMTPSLQQTLGLVQTEQQILNHNSLLFQKKNSQVLKKGVRIGAQIKDIYSNNRLTQEQQHFLTQMKVSKKESHSLDFQSDRIVKTTPAQQSPNPKRIKLFF